jgi:phage repressor protein
VFFKKKFKIFLSSDRKVDITMFSTFDRIKDLAKQKGISLNALEKKLGYSRNTLYSMKDKKPNAERVSEIADYFQVSTDYLLGRTDEPSIARKFYHNGKEIDVEQLASTAMRFNGKPLTEEDKKAIQNIIEIYLSK